MAQAAGEAGHEGGRDNHPPGRSGAQLGRGVQGERARGSCGPGRARKGGRGDEGAGCPPVPHQRAGSSGVRGLRDVGGVRRVTAAHRRRGGRGAQRLARGLAGAAAGLRHAGHACQELRRLSHTAPTTRRAYQHPARTDMLRGGRLRGVRPPPCDLSQTPPRGPGPGRRASLAPRFPPPASSLGSSCPPQACSRSTAGGRPGGPAARASRGRNGAASIVKTACPQEVQEATGTATLSFPANRRVCLSLTLLLPYCPGTFFLMAL